jgi:hypothetical protein
MGTRQRRPIVDPRAVDTTPLNPPDVPVEEIPRELLGEEAPMDQDAIVDTTEIDVRPEITDTELYEGESGLEGDDERITAADIGRLELLTDRELRSGETDDPEVAAEEGLAYVPPTDPPIVPSNNPEGAEIAAGFGSSALDEPYDADHHSEGLPSEDEVTARVREALLADAATSAFAKDLQIDTIGSRVYLRGIVDDVEDTDNAAAVAAEVQGVDEVIDELEVRGGLSEQ